MEGCSPAIMGLAGSSAGREVCGVCDDSRPKEVISSCFGIGGCIESCYR